MMKRVLNTSTESGLSEKYDKLLNEITALQQQLERLSRFESEQRKSHQILLTSLNELRATRQLVREPAAAIPSPALRQRIERKGELLPQRKKTLTTQINQLFEVINKLEVSSKALLREIMTIKSAGPNPVQDAPTALNALPADADIISKPLNPIEEQTTSPRPTQSPETIQEQTTSPRPTQSPELIQEQTTSPQPTQSPETIQEQTTSPRPTQSPEPILRHQSLEESLSQLQALADSNTNRSVSAANKRKSHRNKKTDDADEKLLNDMKRENAYTKMLQDLNGHIASLKIKSEIQRSPETRHPVLLSKNPSEQAKIEMKQLSPLGKMFCTEGKDYLIDLLENIIRHETDNPGMKLNLIITKDALLFYLEYNLCISQSRASQIERDIIAVACNEFLTKNNRFHAPFINRMAVIIGNIIRYLKNAKMFETETALFSPAVLDAIFKDPQSITHRINDACETFKTQMNAVAVEDKSATEEADKIAKLVLKIKGTKLLSSGENFSEQQFKVLDALIGIMGLTTNDRNGIEKWIRTLMVKPTPNLKK